MKNEARRQLARYFIDGKLIYENHVSSLGVSAASGGSWSTRGSGEINPAARGIPFAVSCGEYDRSKSWPGAPLSRLDWMKEFAAELEKADFEFEARVIEGTGHEQKEESLEFARTCFERARSLNLSRTTSG